MTAHPGTISTSRKIFGPWFCSMLAHTSPCKLPGACCGEASFCTAGHPTPIRVLILNAFVPLRTSGACTGHEFLCPSAPHEFTCIPDKLSCMTPPCIDPHEFMSPCMLCVSCENDNDTTESTRWTRCDGDIHGTNKSSKPELYLQFQALPSTTWPLSALESAKLRLVLPPAPSIFLPRSVLEPANLGLHMGSTSTIHRFAAQC